MTRYAVMLGSNGSPLLGGRLKYAEADARRVGTQLETLRCDFEVEYASSKQKASQVRDQILDAALKCSPNDDLLIYFSGHGTLDLGRLYLVWEEEGVDVMRSCLDAEDVLRAVRRSRARNKLVILDCCNAGSAYGEKGADPILISPLIAKENFFVLAASGQIGTARELKDLEGGFLSVRLCEALSIKFLTADQDKDYRLSIQDIHAWLTQCATDHNSKADPLWHVPYPELFGVQQGAFYLTRDELRWSADESAQMQAPNETIFVPLPIRPFDGLALCLSKFPVTNKQYRNHVVPGRLEIPKGVRGDPGREWTTTFSPWDDVAFADPNHPVTCVSFIDAEQYCQALQSEWGAPARVVLPTARLWDTVAFGREVAEPQAKVLGAAFDTLHHRAMGPATVDANGLRPQHHGISDLFGNVWEWCGVQFEFQGSGPMYQAKPQLRGGGFLDDLTYQPVSLRGENLETRRCPDIKHARRYDLGFRPAAVVPVTYLPPIVQERLKICPQATSLLWSTFSKKAELSYRPVGD